jgi:homoserine kinase
MLIPADQLAEIDAQANGNRTAFMIEAAIERAKRLKRARVDDEIASSIRASEAGDFLEYEAWESTLNDGLD